jgi:hypothetical protein
MGTLDGVSISWVRTRVQPERVRLSAGSPALSPPWRYVEVFQAAGEANAWRQPWIGDESFSNYWALGLGDSYRRATADKAWKRQVPLRKATPPTLTTTLPGVGLRCDQYIFPTGIGVLVTAEISGTFDAPGLMTVVSQLGSKGVITVAGSAPKPMSAVVGGMLDAVEREVLGHNDQDSVGGLRLETLATVTATTDCPADPLVQADPVHRLLFGLCQLSAAPLAGNIGDLNQALVEEASYYSGTTRVDLGAGRAVWSPGQSSSLDGVHKLQCYHQNLSLVTMQTDVLLHTVKWASHLAGSLLTDDVKAVLRPVVNVLGLLYGKVDDIYTSALVRRQIDRSGLVAAISDFRIRLAVGGPLS